MRFSTIVAVLAGGILLFGVGQPVQAVPVELVTNGSFETGGFAGWTTATTGSPFRPWAVNGAGSGGGFGMAQTQPQDGSFVAWNGFDGSGPMAFNLWQDVALPGSGTPTLSWSYRAQWNFDIGAFASLPRLFTVEIRDPSDNSILSTVHSFSTGTQAQNPTGDTGWLTLGADLSGFNGQTVRLFFDEQIPQIFTGPGQIEFDAISIEHVPEPATLILLGLGLASLGLRRRRD